MFELMIAFATPWRRNYHAQKYLLPEPVRQIWIQALKNTIITKLKLAYPGSLDNDKTVIFKFRG